MPEQLFGFETKEGLLPKFAKTKLEANKFCLKWLKNQIEKSHPNINFTETSSRDEAREPGNYLVICDDQYNFIVVCRGWMGIFLEEVYFIKIKIIERVDIWEEYISCTIYLKKPRENNSTHDRLLNELEEKFKNRKNHGHSSSSSPSPL